MDASKALDLYASRRDLLNSFLLEYKLLTEECPELTDLFPFDAYVQFCFTFFTRREQDYEDERLQQELRRIQRILALPSA